MENRIKREERRGGKEDERENERNGRNRRGIRRESKQE